MIISFENKSASNIFTEKAILKSLASSGSNITLTVDDNNNFSENDFVMVGNLFSPKTEIAKINAAVTAGTSIQVDSLTFSHNPSDEVQKVKYNQVKLYSSVTDSGTKTLVETKGLDLDQETTDFDIDDDATGYYFFTLYNSNDTTESGYSSAIEVAGTSRNTRDIIKKIIEIHYPFDDLDENKLQLLLDITLEEIYAIRKWRWREASTSFTTTSGTTSYSIVDDIGISDFGQLISARTSTHELVIIDNRSDDLLSMDNLSVANNTIFEYEGNLKVRVQGATTVYLKYFKRFGSLDTTGSTTEIKLPAAIAFNVLKHLYLSSDKSLSDKFEKEYQKQIKLMVIDDEKDIEMDSLSEHNPVNTDIITPTIT